MNVKEKKIFHFRPLFYGFLVFLLAISSSRYLFAGNTKYIILISVAIALFSAYCIWKKHLTSLICICSFFLFGLGWYFVGLSTFEVTAPNQICHVEGRVSDEIAKKTYKDYAVLDSVKIDGTDSANLYLTIEKSGESTLSAGDVIEFDGYVTKSKLFELGSMNLTYYRNKTPYACSVEMSDISFKSNRLRFDEKIRLNVKYKLAECMGEVNGTTAYAVLFGSKSDVDGDVKTAYKSAGILHVLTVSGLHIGFLIMMLGYFLKKCRIRGFWNFLVCAIVLLCYAYLCGFAPSVVRAGIMGLVLLASKLTGKCYDNLNSIGFSGIIILLFSPLSALDIGFLMSYFCVIGIAVVMPTLSKLFGKIFPKTIAESFAVSISAGLGVIPFCANMYSVQNLLSFIVNLIVIPFFGVLYPLLFISTIICTLISAPFMSFLLKICGFGFDFIYKIADFFANTNLKLNLEPINILLVALFFVFLFFIGRFFMASKRVKTACCSVVVALMIVTAGILQIPVQNNTSISYCFSYTNQAVLFKDKTGESVFVDGLSSSFNNNLMKAQRTQAKYMFVLNSNTSISEVRDSGIKNIISCGNSQEYSEEIVVETNKEISVGNFVFKYIAFDNFLLGLEVKFDDISVLLLSKKAEKALNAGVQVGRYDFVIFDKQNNLASYFFDSKILLGYYDSGFLNGTYEKYGNVCCEITNDNYNWRCLD